VIDDHCHPALLNRSVLTRSCLQTVER